MNLTNGEKALLTELGWKEGQAVPENFAAVLQTHGAEAARKLLAAGTSPSATSFLPPEVQATLKSALGGIDINDEVSLEDYKAATAAKKAETPAPEPEPSAPTVDVCPNCQWHVHDQEVVKVTEDDKRAYVLSVISNRHTFKTYSLFDGAVKVVLRSLAPSELDACFFQKTLDLRDAEARSLSDFEVLTRYRMSLCLAELHSGENTSIFPKSLTEWRKLLGKDKATPADVFKHHTETVIQTEMMVRQLCKTTVEFVMYLARMEAAANSPDFWKPTR